MGNKNGTTKNKASAKKELTEEEIAIIINNTEYKRKDVLDFYEQFTKLYPYGELNLDQFKKLYKVLYPHKECDEFLSHIFSMFDSDKSGFVSFSEFCSAISLSGRSNPEEKLRLIFNMYDYTQNGHIERPEIDWILRSVSEVCDEITFEEVMHWSKDGNDYLTQEEFVRFVMDHPKLKEFFLKLIKVRDE